ncbi:hypothetical protein DFJ63DRAFT_308465 [Scheffersomyces coipomensis]|uniref:uncharacterized protein n=1 Tax=Scheffersomyces coipomensis TaxID=1788519 RepID=UPI00315C4E58
MISDSYNINSTIDTNLKHEIDHDLDHDHSNGDIKKSRASTGKRKYHQKSRNGCSTCKKRRVKCDETRPTCLKCQHMKLVCGYVLDGDNNDQSNGDQEHNISSSKDLDNNSIDSISSSKSSSTQQVTPSLTPSPNILDDKPLDQSITSSSINNQSIPFPPIQPNTPLSALSSGLLNAGNLNNLNLSHLVNGLSGDLSNLGGLANLSNLATLAQLPIDLSNIGSLLESQNINIPSFVKPFLSTPTPMPQNISIPQPQKSQPSIQSQSLQQDINQQIPPTPKSTTSNSEHENNSNSRTNNIPPNISPNINNPSINNLSMDSTSLNMLDLRLMFHYTSQVSNTITGAGISETNIWNSDIPMLAFEYPFLMHSILAFSATHLSRTEKGLDQCVTCHRGDALRLLREAVLDINSNNTDALVASALILIMDSLANASFPSSTSPKSLPASAWIFHVKGAATILTAVWPLTESSRFYKFISVDLGDLGDIINQRINLDKQDKAFQEKFFTDLECHDSDIADLFPVEITSPYLITLAYLNKLHKERYKSDFILRIFAFPALLDKSFLSLLMSGDIKAMRIMRSYYKLLRSFCSEMKDKVWFLEGVSQVLPVDVEEYAGGAGGMHMMLDFLGGGPAIIDDNDIDEQISKFDPMSKNLIDTDNLPSDIMASNLEAMSGDNGFMNIK